MRWGALSLRVVADVLNGAACAGALATLIVLDGSTTHNTVGDGAAPPIAEAHSTAAGAEGSPLKSEDNPEQPRSIEGAAAHLESMEESEPVVAAPDREDEPQRTDTSAPSDGLPQTLPGRADDRASRGDASSKSAFASPSGMADPMPRRRGVRVPPIVRQRPKAPVEAQATPPPPQPKAAVVSGASAGGGKQGKASSEKGARSALGAAHREPKCGAGAHYNRRTRRCVRGSKASHRR